MGNWWEIAVSVESCQETTNVPWRQLLYDVMADTIGARFDPRGFHPLRERHAIINRFH